MKMNKNNYLGLILTAFLGAVALPLAAAVIPEAPSHPIGPTPPITEHKAHAEFMKKHAEYYRNMEAYEQSMAKKYGDEGNTDLKTKHEALASHDKSVASEYEPKK